MQFVLFIVAVGLLSLLVAKYIASQIKKADSGNEKMNEIADAIHEGAMAFLIREYKVIAVFIAIMAIIIFVFLDHPKTKEINEAPWTALAFILGSSISILAGFIGMKIATKANVKTANAAQTSLGKAFDIAFKSGSVLGFALVGSAVLGISLSYIFFKSINNHLKDVGRYLSSRHLFKVLVLAGGIFLQNKIPGYKNQ